MTTKTTLTVCMCLFYLLSVSARIKTHATATHAPRTRKSSNKRDAQDLVLESLFYDTAIFMFNLFIVFQDRDVANMVVDVLALEFFTMIDDEFKTALLNYDSSFLDDMLVGARQDGGSKGEREAIAAAAEEGRILPENKGRNKSTCCADAARTAIVWPLIAVLRIVRLICLFVGPMFAFFMVFYGPYCLGLP